MSLNVGYCSWVYGVGGNSVEMDMCVISVFVIACSVSYEGPLGLLLVITLCRPIPLLMSRLCVRV